MEKWRKNRTRGAWSLAWMFALVFHQLLPPLIRGGFDQTSFIIYTLYFGVISLLFTWLFLFIPAWIVAIVLFFFGGFVETALFGIYPDFLLAGLFYVAMFLIPRYASQLIWKPEEEE